MKLVSIISILLIALSFRIFVINFLELPVNHIETPLFLTFLNKSINLPIYIFYIVGLINVLLTYFLAKSFFEERIGVLSSFFYAISPWAVYMELSGSIYTIYTLLILLICLSLIRIRREYNILWIGIKFICVLVLLYSNLIIGLILFLFSLLFLSDISDFKKYIRYFFIAAFLSLLPLLLIFIFKGSQLKSFFYNEVTIFSDPGFINSVNVYQGENKKAHINIPGKIIENKYTYGFEYVANNFLSNISLVTYFTNQSKILDFSFSPPIFIALLIPFSFGIFMLSKSVKTNKKWILIGLLILPSLLSQYSPNLSKLIIISPFVFTIIGYGLNYQLKYKQKTAKYLIFIVLTIFILQFFVTLEDITTREPLRLHNYLTNR